ncbi:YpmS family protein [Loigolactobacillus backii]|uniref:YpmS family protein n=1 Tax=Loigolactobacillus backii TaxID=375175 RepID=UPI0008302EEC|nr:YpmS family protein [Loigolactobacillus backii]MDA5387005.1 YpmS family protein [Loigolactobacillus backii]MDA5389543.1 YpmS family protein [Loigolactobacillus backii]OLF69991.1 hypothetical protein ACX53_04895 [Loigolactobacillus backii]PIO83382.1 hypothetical protein BSQ39_07350 [Loigolactobacillus backii]PIO87784.1 hypothetical protein B8A32_11825 [Loigolactobacillus backii]
MTTRTQKKTKPTPTSFNIWKWLFIILVAIIVGTGVYFGHKITQPPAQTAPNEQLIKRQATFSVNLNKSQVNDVIGYYLNHYLKKTKIKYTFDLGDQAVLKGKFKLLGYGVPFSIYLDPYVMENGDVQLKAKRMEIGALSVPIKVVMNYIGNSYKFPKWVVLNSKKETIQLRLNQFKMKNGMQIKAKKIDLANNKINLDVYLPQVTSEGGQ